MTEALRTTELAILFCLHYTWQHPAIDRVMVTLSQSEIWLVGLFILFLIQMAVVRGAEARRRAIGVALLVIIAGSFSDMICTYVFKPFFARPRPCHGWLSIRLSGCGSPFGFPSNHAANSFAIAGTLVLAYGWKWMWPIALIAFLVGLSRNFLGVHYPTDVFIGFCVGATIALGIWRLVGRRGLLANN